MKFKDLFACLAIICGAQVHAFWRMPCQRSGIARIDPLMAFNEIGQHVHTIHGSSEFSETATYDDLVSANCTSCGVTQDKSVYWAPALYFQDNSTGEFTLVEQVGGILAYYFLNSLPGENITAFPEGFRMIAGNSLRRNYTAGDGNAANPDPPKSEWAALGQTDQDTLSQRALGFNCLWYNNPAGDEASLYRHFLPDKTYTDAHCPNGLRLELMFPSCWNGKDLDSTDHKSHVAYPDLVITGNCPDDFPVRFPGLFYEIIWNTYAFKDTPGRFVLANGDPLGYGYHGDFMMGWKEEILQEAVNVCTNGSGKIADCPVFTDVEDTALPGECQMPLPANLAKENVVSVAGTLPGNVAIQYGPQQATLGVQATDATSPTTAVSIPTLSFSVAQVNTAGTYGVGDVLHSTTTTSTSITSPAATPLIAGVTMAKGADPVPALPSSPSSPSTTSAPVATDSGLSYDVISTQYLTNGPIVSEIVWEEAIVYVTETDAVTSTILVTATAPAKVRRGSHLHRHRHVHGRR
ncbi:WSC domain-containing protein [Pleurostoma richardsiae]|uniref:WSC domain-containing protein n=1 Tax=Pleurostoma richardsiae TaxID=41990 RepID=A0AA38R745_9PEZI|nr:WSC domain-containing protein [Pleurostoma richardsiae]